MHKSVVAGVWARLRIHCIAPPLESTAQFEGFNVAPGIETD